MNLQKIKLQKISISKKEVPQNPGETPNKIEFQYGDNQTVTVGGKISDIKISEDISKFVRVLVDGKELGREFYSATKGSTVIKFNDNFAPTLAVGTHKLVFEFTTGKIETSLTMVKKDDVPSDNNNNNNNNNNNDNINRPNHKPNNKIDNNKNKNRLVKTGISNSSILLFALSAILLGTLTIRKIVKK